MCVPQYFEYTETELDRLKSKDAALAAVIEQIGPVRREIIPDMFMALVHALIGQQISMKAHRTVWDRVQNICGPVTPDHVAELPVEQLRTCGISGRKIMYIKGVAADVLAGKLDLAHLGTLDDAALCKRLIAIPGVGVWTAEMLMIFSMQRKNILSWGDLAIQRGLRMLYRHRKITPVLFARYKKRYSPYASIAGLYLWALAGGACIGYTDPASPKKLRTSS